MNMNSFITAEDRKTMREGITHILANGSCEEKFKVDTARVYLRLLDTIDYFEQANFTLSKKNVDLEFEVMDEKDKNVGLSNLLSNTETDNLHFRDLSDSVTSLYGTVDSMLINLVPLIERMDKLEARITKKKTKQTIHHTKKSTTKR